MKAMESSSNHKIDGKAEVYETVVAGRKKLVVFAIERNGQGVSRMYGKVIKQSSSKELGEFMKASIDINAQIKTDK